MSIRNELQGVWGIYVAAYRAGEAAGCAAVFSSEGNCILLMRHRLEAAQR
jgi:hypothetical protein